MPRPADIQAVRARVTGRVQGVWFRDWTRGEAQRMGLSGWVRNEPDRSVTAHFEGPPDQVHAMTLALWHGPDLAEVTEVETEVMPPSGLSGFRIVH